MKTNSSTTRRIGLVLGVCGLTCAESAVARAQAISTPPEQTACSSTPADPVAFCQSLAGYNVIIGTSNNDVLVGTAGPDCIVGLGGQDTISGMGGDDIIFGGDGDDIIHGGDGNDQIFGGSGQDQIFGDSGNDLLYGEDGDDVIHGGDGDDVLSGGQGQDKLFGEGGNDTLSGGSGDDTLSGGDGNDSLDDCVDHNAFDGGTGVNTCAGDSTASTFVSCQTTLACTSAPGLGNGGTPGGGGGSGVGPGGSLVLAQNAEGAVNIAINDTTVYFTDLLGVRSIPRTGGTPVTVLDAIGSNEVMNEGLVLDDSFLYGALRENATPGPPESIFRMPLTGGSPTTLVSATLTPGNLEPLFPQSTGGLVYSVTFNSEVEPNEVIQSTPVGGPPSATSVLFSASFFYPAVQNLRPYVVSCGTVFFQHLDLTNGSIAQVDLQSIPAAGGPVTTLLANATASDSPEIAAIDSDGQFLYYTSRTTVRRIPVGGGPAQVLAVDPDGVNVKLVVDSTNVYWLSNEFGPMGECLEFRVMRVAKTGGTPTVLEDLPSLCGTDLAHDTTTLFWTDSLSDDGLGGGEVRRLQK
jgi:hypothetical protein